MPHHDRLFDPPPRRPVVFLGGPFKALIDTATGQLPQSVRRRYAALIAAFEDEGWEVLSAHRTEEWGAGLVSDADCTRRDLEWMRRCSVFVAFPGDPASPGTHVELGWASALGRPTVVLVEPGTQPAALVTGLPAVAPVQLVEYRDDPEHVAEVVRLVTVADAFHSARRDPAVAS
jgi:nucleoside 2-deoxyribosyltransferase